MRSPGVAQTPKIVILQSSNNVGSPPLLPTRAKRSKSGSFGDDPTSTCLKTAKNCKKLKNKPSTSATSNFDVPKNRRAPPGPLRGPEGPGGAPPEPPDFWCNRHCRTSPVVLEGFGGQVLAENRPKTDPKIRMDR